MDQKPRGPMTISDDERRFFVKLGARIATARQAHGLTQAELAGELGIAQQTLNSFEKGIRRVPASSLPTLARVLRLSLEELVGEPTKPVPRKRGPASKLDERVERLRRLPRREQEFIIQVIDRVLEGGDARR